jgi:hypothetical protein
VRETNFYTHTKLEAKLWVCAVACRALSRQQLGKYVPAATDTHATAEELFMTEFICAVSEEQKTVAITEIALNLMKQTEN